MIFFALALFGFGCLTTLATFSSERLLFTRERANGYYNPLTYLAAKLLFDVIPLRVIPAFVFGAIVYAPVGLVPEIVSFWRFILVLVLFNLASSSVVLLLSIVIKNQGVANLVGSLVMLFKCDRPLAPLRARLTWAHSHAQPPLRRAPHQQGQAPAVPAVARDDVVLPRRVRGAPRQRGPVPPTQGPPLCVPSPASSFLSWLSPHAQTASTSKSPPRRSSRCSASGRRCAPSASPPTRAHAHLCTRAQAFWFPDVTLLAAYIAGFTVLSYGALVLFVKERR